MKIILYSNNCPKCNVLEKKLSSIGISYEIVTDTDLMVSKGFDTMPVLEVDGKIMDFRDAIDWANNYKE